MALITRVAQMMSINDYGNIKKASNLPRIPFLADP